MLTYFTTFHPLLVFTHHQSYLYGTRAPATCNISYTYLTLIYQLSVIDLVYFTYLPNANVFYFNFSTKLTWHSRYQLYLIWTPITVLFTCLIYLALINLILIILPDTGTGAPGVLAAPSAIPRTPISFLGKELDFISMWNVGILHGAPRIRNHKSANGILRDLCSHLLVSNSFVYMARSYNFIYNITAITRTHLFDCRGLYV